jgi:transposase
MNTQKNYVGIDIAKNSFVVCYRTTEGQKYSTTSYPYTAETLTKLPTLLPPNCHCVIEYTGTYHHRLWYELSAQGVAVSLVRGEQVRYFAKMRNLITKTDAQDALVLAQYGASEQPAHSSYPPKELLQLKQRRHLLQQFKTQHRRLCNQLEALGQYAQIDTFTQDCLVSEIAHIAECIQKIQTEIKTLIQSHYQSQVDLLQSIPGIGETTAQAFVETIHSFQGFETQKNHKAFAKFVGLAPSQHQSGTSVRGQSHIHKASQTDLRQKLYRPLVSLCTKKKDNIFKQFFCKLRQNGKSFKEALIAVMHKLIRIGCAVVKSARPFDEKLYGNTLHPTS